MSIILEMFSVNLKRTAFSNDEKKVQTYLGGSAAVANHLSSFCNKVNFLTYVGKESKI